MKKIANKITKIILNIISIFLILLIFVESALIFQKTVLHKKYADIFGYSIFTVASGSMIPTLQINDGVIVHITKDIIPNDIIVYEEQKDEMIIAHRVIKINENTVITKGDNNNIEDKEFSKDLIIGKIVKILPQFGKIQAILTSPIVIMLILVITFIYIIIKNLVNFKNNVN